MEDIAPAFTASGLTMSSDCGTMAHHNVRVCNLCNLVGFLHWLVGEHDGLPRSSLIVTKKGPTAYPGKWNVSKCPTPIHRHWRCAILLP